MSRLARLPHLEYSLTGRHVVSRGACSVSLVCRNLPPESPLPGSALVAAAEKGDKWIISRPPESGADVNGPSGHRHQERYALEMATEKRHTEIVKLLLQKGANVSAVGGLGDALQQAAYKGHKEIVSLLPENSAKVDESEGLYGGAVQAATLGRNLDIVQLLVDRGADVNIQRTTPSRTSRVMSCRTSLEAAVAADSYEIAKCLLENGATIADSGSGVSVLSIAAAKGYDSIVELLIRYGSDPNRGDDTTPAGGINFHSHSIALAKARPICHTLLNRHHASMRLLINAGADFASPSPVRNIWNISDLAKSPAGGLVTPLSCAVCIPFEEGVELLLYQGADPNALSHFDEGSPEPALHTAARIGHSTISRLLLERGGNVDYQIDGGCKSI